MNKKTVTVIPRVYANILFVDHAAVGTLFFIATLWYPNIGLAGLLGAVSGLITVKLLHFSDTGSDLKIYNSLLVGLSLGAFYQLNIYMFMLIILGAIFAVFVSVVIADALWRLDRLPALSLPFILSVLATTPVARHYSSLSDYMGMAEPQHHLFAPWLDGFFSSLASIFFTPQPIVGLILFLGIVWRSRYLGLLAFVGYAFGYLIFNLLTENPHPGLVVWTGFNFMLTAMAIAGIYTVPSLIGFMLAMLAVAINAMLVVATQDLLMVYGLPVMAIPFVITTLFFISSLGKRMQNAKPWLALQAGLPEVNYERARLAQVRNGEFNSIALLPPFMGEWEVYQGFNGEHTHKDLWRHALDFYMTEEGVSYSGRGDKLSDYYCYGLPIVSPVHGDVVRFYDKLADNAPGEVDTDNNWGNFILIRLQGGLHVLLAHLQKNSVKIKEGDHLKPGDIIAACGNSGRSPQPHIHLQVQREAVLGSATHPFHLTSVLQSEKQTKLEYRLVSRPREGDRIQSAKQDTQLSSQLHLPVGRVLRYQVGFDNEQKKEIELRVELTLLGQFRLISDSGASAAFEETNGVLAFYDRQGPKDPLLDFWMLASGLTPLSDLANRWRDAPSATLFPLHLQQRLILWILMPLGAGLNSQYEREWNKSSNNWIQSGWHHLRIGVKTHTLNSQSTLDPVYGYSLIEIEYAGKHWSAKLVDTGLVGDRGVPGWRLDSGREIERDSANDSLHQISHQLDGHKK